MTSMIRIRDRFRHYLQRCTRCASHSWRQQQHALPNDGSGPTCRGSPLRSFFRDRSCRRQAALKVENASKISLETHVRKRLQCSVKPCAKPFQAQTSRSPHEVQKTITKPLQRAQDVFIGHSWSASRWSKFLALCLRLGLGSQKLSFRIPGVGFRLPLKKGLCKHVVNY